MATIKDVAKLANLGTSTVSRYFNKTGFVSKESAEKIEEVCRELHYSPNALARAVKTKRTFTICLIVPSIASFFYAELSTEIEQTCRKRGYKVLLYNAANDEQLHQVYYNILQQGFVDGMIITTPFNLYKELIDKIPLVIMENVKVKGKAFNIVSSDHYGGSYLACEYLIKNKCEAILFVYDTLTCESIKQRKLAYEACMKLNKKKVMAISLNELKNDGYRLLTMNSIDGMLAANDHLGAQLMEVCRELKIRIPEDMQLIGYDDVTLASYLNPNLTTIAQPIESLGSYAVNIVIDSIEGIQKEEINIILSNELIIRNTTKEN